MVIPPGLEPTLLIGDAAELVAEVSSLFRRPKHYLPVSDAPRMARQDFESEIVRRSNMVAKMKARQVLFCGVPTATVATQTKKWPSHIWSSVHTREEAEEALRGTRSFPKDEYECVDESLGIGLLKARIAGLKLRVRSLGLPGAGRQFIPGGKHALVVCERGEALSEVIASNLAFSLGAGFVIFPELPEEVREDWLDSLYQIGSQNQRKRFPEICSDATEWLPSQATDGSHKELIFITREFPWGIATPGQVSSHVFSYPDFGRNVLAGVLSVADRSRSSRSSLLIEPGEVAAPEMATIADALHENGGLVRRLEGARATVARASITVQATPFDVMVFATHAGEWRGERQTFEYADEDGKLRRLVVDEAHGFGYDPHTDLVQVQTYWRFHSLDGVLWSDRKAKGELPVGTGLSTWVNLDLSEKRKLMVASQAIDRVRGAMALKMVDGIWMPAMHDLPPHCAPFVFNNACGSFHGLAGAFIYAGARAYIGTLFPVSDAEAHDVASEFFSKHIGRSGAHALWLSQNKVYGEQSRRPYVMFGLPFCGIYATRENPVPALIKEIQTSIENYTELTNSSPAEDVRRNSKRLLVQLKVELRTLQSIKLSSR